jgi:hypothetical protein
MSNPAPNREPIAEQIVQNVRDVLATIQRSAGYSCNADVERARADGNPAGDLEALVVVDERNCVERPDMAPGAMDCYMLTLFIDFVFGASTSSSDPPGRHLNRLEADIRRVCLENVTWGGLAMMTYFDTKMTNAKRSDADLLMRRMPIDILFYTQPRNPYAQ